MDMVVPLTPAVLTAVGAVIGSRQRFAERTSQRATAGACRCRSTSVRVSRATRMVGPRQRRGSLLKGLS